MLLKVTAAALHSAQSKVLRICVPTRFGIKLYPRFQKMQPNYSLIWMKTEPLTAPRAPTTVPLQQRTPNKSFYHYSLTVKRGGCQQDAVNGQKEGLNGSLGQ